MNPETKIQRRIMLELSMLGCLVFRNETAKAWTGRVLHKDGTTVTIGNAQMLPFGLAIGSSDLIGLTPQGRFFAIEVKTKTGKPTTEQLLFIESIKANGGLAGIARNIEEAIAILGL